MPDPPEATTNTTAAPPTTSQQQTCAHCSQTPDTPLKQCLKCHSTSYCRKDCQKAHFKTHKKVCAALAQEYAKTHEPKMASRGASARNEGRERGLQKWQFDT